MKPWFVKLNEKQWAQTVEYFNRRELRAQARAQPPADQRSRIAVNERRRRKALKHSVGPAERGVYHARGDKDILYMFRQHDKCFKQGLNNG